MTSKIAPFLMLLFIGCDGSIARHAAAGRSCVPGQNVYCLCPGGTEKGTQRCLESGKSFGPCEPCLEPADVAQRGESDVLTADDLPAKVEDGKTQADLPQDFGAEVGKDAAQDAGQLLATDGKCPGEIMLLDAQFDTVWQGSTSLTWATATGEGACAIGAAGHDIAYQLDVPERGRVTVKVLVESGFDPVVYARSGACLGKQVGCSDDGGPGGKETLQFFAVPGTPVYLFIDGKQKIGGPFSVVVQFQAGVFCGDGVVDPEEACDDGNAVEGDGCSPACKPDGFPAQAASCPGQAVHVWALPVEISATTATFADVQEGTCGGKSGRDAVYAVVPHGSGSLKAAITKTDFDTVLYARSAPCATGTELGCANSLKVVGGEKLTVPVTKNEALYLFVDGYKFGKGSFHLQLSIE